MSNFVRSIGNCCTPSCTTPTVVNTPGPQGPAGTNGNNGSDGQPAYTTITDITGSPVQPAVGSTVTLTIGSNTWMIPATSSPEGMRICIGDPLGASYMGYYRVVSLSGIDQVTIENLGYLGNAAPGTTFTVGMRLSPAGIKGQDSAGTGVYDTVALTNGVNTQAIVAPSGNFGFIPSAVIGTVLKPSGGMTFAVNVHTLATGGFTADFTANVPATGNYYLQYIAYP